MTCVVAYIDKNRNIHMSADSNGSNVSYHTKIELATSKIFKRDNMLFGFTTSFRMGQLLEHIIVFPEREEGLSDYEYLIKQFIPVVRKAFLDEGYMLSTEKSGGNFVIGWNGRLYNVESDFSVFMLTNDYVSIGSGSDIAHGAIEALILYGIIDVENIQQKVMEVIIRIVSKLNITVSGRVDYINNIP